MDRASRIEVARTEHRLYHSSCVTVHNPKKPQYRVCKDPCHQQKG